MKTMIRLQREMWNDKISMYFGQITERGELSVFRTANLEKIAEGEHYGDPFMRLEIESAQRLMDELWNCGVRPSEGSGSAGSLAATERHLEDLQKITTALLCNKGISI
jgi:hypothetical protein